MKKIVISLIAVLIIFLLAMMVLFNFHPSDKSDKNLTKIKLAEVTHSIFYAPQYVAIEKGFFEEEGIKIDLSLTPGADKVSAAVLSGDVQIGFAGSEATIYVYNGGEKDYLKTFAQLTQKDGSFIVAREKIENFTLDNLKGKTIIGGRQGGMPEMTLEWALREHGLDPKKDVHIDTSIEFAAMSGAFLAGNGDFVSLFEPTALALEQQGGGYVVASLGELGGVVPYTAYFARDSYLNENKDLIKAFVRAIQKGLDYVHTHSDKEVAKAILNQFPDTSLKDLEEVVSRYRKIDAWPKDTTFKEESFEHLQKIIQAAGELEKTVPFDQLTYSTK